jgi:hypothetical protein
MKELHSDRVPALLPPADGEVYSDEEIENAIEEGLMGRVEAGELSGRISVRGGLELVTSTHVPRAGTRRQAKLREPRKARTWQEKLAADQPPESQRPPEWDEGRRLTVVKPIAKNHF